MSLHRIDRIIQPKGEKSVIPDLVCSQKLENASDAQTSALFRVHHSHGSILIRFDWCVVYVVRDMDESDLLLVPETETLFFRTMNQWGAIDLRTATVVRHEEAMCLPGIYRYERAIVIEDELQAEVTDLTGAKFATVPIDPPWDAEEFDDRIEYNSPVYGKRVLRFP